MSNFDEESSMQVKRDIQIQHFENNLKQEQKSPQNEQILTKEHK